MPMKSIFFCSLLYTEVNLAFIFFSFLATSSAYSRFFFVKNNQSPSCNLSILSIPNYKNNFFLSFVLFSSTFWYHRHLQPDKIRLLYKMQNYINTQVSHLQIPLLQLVDENWRWSNRRAVSCLVKFKSSWTQIEHMKCVLHRCFWQYS